MFDTITRSLSAFEKAVSKLKTYYKELPTQTSTTLASRDKKIVLHQADEARLRLAYKLQGGADFGPQVSKCGRIRKSGKLLFQGWTKDQPVVVKFVRSYSKDLHEHCAASALAPLLLGFEKLPGDWLMVVMEYMVDYEVFSTWTDPASISTQLRRMAQSPANSQHIFPITFTIPTNRADLLPARVCLPVTNADSKKKRKENNQLDAPTRKSVPFRGGSEGILTVDSEVSLPSCNIVSRTAS
jgi:hypothetical protein